MFESFLRGISQKPTFKWEHYFPIYETHLNKYRNLDVTLFEIGVLGGGSLEMWRQFLGPRATIVGIDIDPSCKEYVGHGIEIEIGDQSDADFISRVISKYGNPDIVIDDGSHISSDIQSSLNLLLPAMPKNSTYLIEDCHTLFHAAWGGNSEATGTLLDWVRNQFNVLHRHYIDPDADSGSLAVTGLHVYDSVVVLDIGFSKKFKAFQIAAASPILVAQELSPEDFTQL